MKEQFIMAYGGLRGAVGFSLVLLIDKNTVPSAGTRKKLGHLLHMNNFIHHRANLSISMRKNLV